MDGMDKFQSDMAEINARVDQLIRERDALKSALDYVCRAHEYAHEREWHEARLREIGEHAYESGHAALRYDSLNRARALLAKVNG